MLNEAEVTDFTQSTGGVRVEIRGAGGEPLSAQGRYLVGCDGGRSMVRGAIGAKLRGDAVVQRVQSTYIRAPGLIDLMEVPPTWGMFAFNPVRTGVVYSIDGRETWLVHNYLRDDEADFDSIDRDWAIRQILGVDDDHRPPGTQQRGHGAPHALAPPAVPESFFIHKKWSVSVNEVIPCATSLDFSASISSSFAP